MFCMGGASARHNNNNNDNNNNNNNKIKNPKFSAHFSFFPNLKNLRSCLLFIISLTRKQCIKYQVLINSQ